MEIEAPSNHIASQHDVTAVIHKTDSKAVPFPYSCILIFSCTPSPNSPKLYRLSKAPDIHETVRDEITVKHAVQSQISA